MRVLVTDGNSRSSLAVTRSLGEKGIKVFVGEESKKNLSAASKYCHKSFSYPSPYTATKNFLTTIQKIVANENINIM